MDMLGGIACSAPSARQTHGFLRVSRLPSRNRGRDRDRDRSRSQTVSNLQGVRCPRRRRGLDSQIPISRRHALPQAAVVPTAGAVAPAAQHRPIAGSRAVVAALPALGGGAAPVMHGWISHDVNRSTKAAPPPAVRQSPSSASSLRRWVRARVTVGARPLRFRCCSTPTMAMAPCTAALEGGSGARTPTPRHQNGLMTSPARTGLRGSVTCTCAQSMRSSSRRRCRHRALWPSRHRPTEARSLARPLLASAWSCAA